VLYFILALRHNHFICKTCLLISLGSRTSLAHPESGDQSGVVAEVVADGTSDVGLIERPRDMTASSSSSSQHLPSSKSAARAVGGCSDAGSRQSSSLNRDRRTSPDHIPRLHECWSLEPVRRATNRGAGSRGATEPSSELSSLDSLPAYAGQRHTSSGICTDLGEQASITDSKIRATQVNILYRSSK